MTQKAYKVAVTESERGWGRKIDDYMVCQSHEDALAFTKEFNSKNTEETAPDWYMVVEHDPEQITLTQTQFDYLIESNRVWLSDLKRIK